MIVLMVLSGMFVACAGEQRPLFIPSTPLATQMTERIVDNTPTPAATETAVATARFTYQGITFSYANGLMRRLTTERLPAVAGATGLPVSDPPIYYFGVPDYVWFNFETDSSSPAPSQLVIQRLRDDEGNYYSAYSETEVGRFEQLATRIKPQTVDSDHSLHTNLLDFADGSGIRSVGFMPVFSGTVPLSDAHIFYLYEGLTQDGRYYVWLQFNLQTPILPDKPGQFSVVDQAEFIEETAVYQAYLDEQMALIQALPPAAFTPNLAHLDDLIHSLSVPAEAAATSSLPINEPDCTNRAAYITDITLPSGTRLAAGQTVIKTWRLQNAGSCTWSPAYRLIREDSPLHLQENALIPVVLPGETADISIHFPAPIEPGTYQETWHMQTPFISEQDPPYELFGPALTLRFEVMANEP